MVRIWKKIGEPVILAGKFGKKLITQVFKNPKTDKPEEYVLFAQKDWSVVLAITEFEGEPHILVVSEYKQGRDCIDVELPAGTATSDLENPLEVARRELLEETGYEAREIVSLGYGWMSTRNSPTRFHCYLAPDCIKVDDQKLDENEEIETELIPLIDWIAMVSDGRINEPSAVVTTVRSLGKLGLKIVSSK